MMRILFLDMDGVVNSAAYFEVLSKRAYKKARGKAKAEARTKETFVKMIDPAAIPLLNEIVKRGKARIVISSSWRIPWTHQQIAQMLWTRGFVGEVIGATPKSVRLPVGVEHERGYEIQAWLDGMERQVKSFVILDDSNDMAHLKPRLVQTSWAMGLQPDHVDQAVAILKKDL